MKLATNHLSLLSTFFLFTLSSCMLMDKEGIVDLALNIKDQNGNVLPGYAFYLVCNDNRFDAEDYANTHLFTTDTTGKDNISVEVEIPNGTTHLDENEIKNSCHIEPSGLYNAPNFKPNQIRILSLEFGSSDFEASVEMDFIVNTDQIESAYLGQD